MTDPDYRGKGYSREIMELILSDYDGKVDGIYLFANDSVVSFYPKFGFREFTEYQYSKDVSINCERTVTAVSMADKNDWDRMVKIINEKPQNSNMYMTGNPGLYMFYLSQFMTENVFCLSDDDTYAVAEEEGDTLILHAVFGCSDLDKVIYAFGKNVKRVALCLTPQDPSGFTKQELHEEDTTLFVKGTFFDRLDDEGYMFQAITHA